MYEGSLRPLLSSKRGASHGFHKQLRDPNVFIEDGDIYILYCGGGESNIIIAEIGGDG